MSLLIKLLVKITPLHFLLASIKEIGWSVVLKEDGEFVDGLVIGTKDYIERHAE